MHSKPGLMLLITKKIKTLKENYFGRDTSDHSDNYQHNYHTVFFRTDNSCLWSDKTGKKDHG